MNKLTKEKILPTILAALKEDVGLGDITSQLVFDKDWAVMADLIAKEDCIIAGIDVARWTFTALDEKIVFTTICEDGDVIKKGKKVASLKGSARNILTTERTALNFLAKLSGVATLTSTFVKKVKNTKAKIYDTRKTTPCLREMEKYAVKCGGGLNNRIGLWDGVLIKDNHLKFFSIGDTINKAKERHHRNIEIEVDSLEAFKEALDASPDIIMLDNMNPEDMKKAVKLKGPGRPTLEASGGINLENVLKVAKTGVDRISVGLLTHSAPSIDFSLEIYRT